MKKLSNIKKYVVLHFCILLYTFVTVLSKFAARFSFLSDKYILCVGGVFGILGLYALFWQQIIKQFKTSVAYSNKSVTTIWVVFLSNIFFGESITFHNIIGAVIIILGVIMVHVFY